MNLTDFCLNPWVTVPEIKNVLKCEGPCMTNGLLCVYNAKKLVGVTCIVDLTVIVQYNKTYR